MKNGKRYFSMLVCILLLACASCGGKQPVQTTEEPSVQTSDPAPERTDLYIVRDGVTQFTVINPEKGADNVVNGAGLFKNDLDSWTGTVFPAGNDAQPRSAGDCEILIGNCAVNESEEFVKSLGSDEYGFAVAGNKIVIAGKTDNLTVVAMKKFKDTVIVGKEYRKGSDIVLPSDFRMKFTQTGTDAEALCPWAVTQDDFRIIASVSKPVCSVSPSGQYSVAQGAATDGQYFFNALVSSSGTGIIVRTPLDGNKSNSTKSGAMTLNHANDICWNSREKTLVLVNMNGNRLTYIDPQTLSVTKTGGFQGDGGTYAITYNEKNNAYAVFAGSSIYICDGDMKIKSQRSTHFEGDYTAQGADSDDNFIYAPYSIGQNTKDSLIAVYSWTGKHVRTIHLPVSMECETMMNAGGKYFMSFYASGAVICGLSFNIYY